MLNCTVLIVLSKVCLNFSKTSLNHMILELSVCFSNLTMVIKVTNKHEYSRYLSGQMLRNACTHRIYVN